MTALGTILYPVPNIGRPRFGVHMTLVSIISLLIKEVNRIWFQYYTQFIKTTYSGKECMLEVQFCTTKSLQFCEFKVASCRLRPIKTFLEVVKITQRCGPCMPTWHLLVYVMYVIMILERFFWWIKNNLDCFLQIIQPSKMILCVRMTKYFQQLARVFHSLIHWMPMGPKKFGLKRRLQL